jgi:hypothetical protein
MERTNSLPATNGVKTVRFGAVGYSDYTVHKDRERRRRYIARHGMGREDWSDPNTAGFWSRWLLWGEHTSLEANLRDISKRLRTQVEFKRT